MVGDRMIESRENNRRDVMNVIEFLKSENSRLSCGNRWMCWDNIDDWTVRENPYGSKVNVVYRGESLDEALEVLKG